MSAVHDWQVRSPRSHGLAIALGHHARRLGDVAEVVRDPGGEQLAQSDGTQRGMLPLEGELAVAKVPTAERREVLGAQPGEFVEQLRETLALALPDLREAVIGHEAAIVALGEDDPRARNPVGALAMDEMPDVVEWAEGVGPFIRRDPCSRQIGEQGPESCRRALEDGDTLGELEGHDEGTSLTCPPTTRHGPPCSRAQTRV